MQLVVKWRSIWFSNSGRRLVWIALLCLVVSGCALPGQRGSSPTQPAGPAVIAAPAQLAAYHVFVTDLLTGNVASLGAQTTHVSLSVHGLGLSRDGHWLFVTDVAGGKLVAYHLNGSQLGASHRVTVGGYPVHMAQAPDGHVFVTNFGGADVSVVDTTAWRVERTIEVPAGPHGIALSPDGRYAYVACYKSATVAIISTITETLAGAIALPAGTEPYGVVTSADGRYLYVTANGRSSVYVLDAQTRRIVTDVQVGLRPQLIARSPDGKTLYVPSGSGHSLTFLDIGADAAHPIARGSTLINGYPHGVAVTPDGRYVIVADTTGKTVSVVDARTMALVATISGMQEPNDALATMG
ncbi:MAG: beta-propeller fold lactonase family protein [Ktedonobacterales bacterium]